ncbi:MAG TPA: L,D-transpeptidase family protein, partial [Woeseiaceae bacterium]|nr:L,D-transpeptidase family protein [Woeseiaceae bacterium]
MKTLAVALTALLLPGLMQASEFPVADRVVIEKGARELHLIQDGKAFRTYKIALGIRPVGDKKKEGDFKTPEGKYYLDARNP